MSRVPRPAVVKGFAVGVIVGTVVVASAAAARADVDNAAWAYAETFGSAVCVTLDSYPSTSGILGVARSIMGDGLTSFQAGEVIMLSARDLCPRHLPLVLSFARSVAA